jgi:hypothetical protein
VGVTVLTAISVWTEDVGQVIAYALCSVAMIWAWRKLADPPLSWVGLISGLLGFFAIVTGEQSSSWHEGSLILLFVALVSNGLVLARSGRTDRLANPKGASTIWGALGMISVLMGLVLGSEVAGWTTAGWALGAVTLLGAGFWGGLRGYRVIGLIGIGCAILRLFIVDLDETFWRIVAFGVTGSLLVGIGFVYNRFHQRLAEHDLDWRQDDESEELQIGLSKKADP